VYTAASAMSLRVLLVYGSVIGLLQDISDICKMQQQQAEKEAATAQLNAMLAAEIKHKEEMYRLLRTISHEIRNPLHGILANTQALLDLVCEVEQQAAEVTRQAAVAAAATTAAPTTAAPTTAAATTAAAAPAPAAAAARGSGCTCACTCGASATATAGVSLAAAEPVDGLTALLQAAAARRSCCSNSNNSSNTSRFSWADALYRPRCASEPLLQCRPLYKSSSSSSSSDSPNSFNRCPCSPASSSSSTATVPRRLRERSFKGLAAAAPKGSVVSCSCSSSSSGNSSSGCALQAQCASRLALVKDMVGEIHECGLHQVSVSPSCHFVFKLEVAAAELASAYPSLLLCSCSILLMLLSSNFVVVRSSC
jgi:His Kinase A (phospho-acceptor) domain